MTVNEDSNAKEIQVMIVGSKQTKQTDMKNGK